MISGPDSSGFLNKWLIIDVGLLVSSASLGATYFAMYHDIFHFSLYVFHLKNRGL